MSSKCWILLRIIAMGRDIAFSLAPVLWILTKILIRMVAVSYLRGRLLHPEPWYVEVISPHSKILLQEGDHGAGYTKNLDLNTKIGEKPFP